MNYDSTSADRDADIEHDPGREPQHVITQVAALCHGEVTLAWLNC